MLRDVVRLTTRLIALLNAIAVVVAVCLSVVALCQTDWRTIDGLPNEQVAPNVTFKHLRIGETKTCVKLHLFSNDTQKWRDRETCYSTFLGENQLPTTARDLVTGQLLVLNPVCSADRDWVALKLGIPERVNVIEIWDKQCAGYQWFNVIMQALAWCTAFYLAYELLVLVADKAKPTCRVFWICAVTSLPVVMHMVPTLVWLFAMDVGGFEVGISLKFSIAATIIFALAWLFEVVVLVGPRCIDHFEERGWAFAMTPKV